MRSNELKNKRVLLIAPSFFGYYKAIIQELKNRGALVSYVDADPSDFIRFWLSFLTSHSSFNIINIREKLIDCFEENIYNSIKNNKFDLLIVICGKYVTSNLINNIKSNLMNDGAYSVLYYWDSRDLLKDDESRIHLFDKITTFDHADYEKSFGCFDFLPLFYTKDFDYKESKEKIKYDLTSIGSYKYNRYIFLEKLRKNNPNLSFFFYQYNSIIAFIPHKLFRLKYKNIKLKNIRFQKLSRREINEIYAKSGAILDIPIEGQNGLTMRTFECLGAHKKIVTTNKNIKKYDFYNPDYIYIIEDDYILPNKEWFANENISWPEDIISQYSLKSWMTNLISLK